jgi:hypothetical protein
MIRIAQKQKLNISTGIVVRFEEPSMLATRLAEMWTFV